MVEQKCIHKGEQETQSKKDKERRKKRTKEPTLTRNPTQNLKKYVL